MSQPNVFLRALRRFGISNAELADEARLRTAREAGSYSSTRPVADCSRMSSTLASKVPPHSWGAKRVEASLR